MDKILDVFELYADSNENKINDFNRRLSSTMDVKIEAEKPKIEGLWMDKVEKTIPYIENILAAPTRLIVNEEEVVKIENNIEYFKIVTTNNEYQTKNLILATGGTGMVRSAYSCGKPALGVGPGNVPCYIDKTAKLKTSVNDLVMSKAFDNGMI